jgi:hypothetical protein
VKRRFRSCYSPPTRNEIWRNELSAGPTEFKRVPQGPCQNEVQPVPISNAEDTRISSIRFSDIFDSHKVYYGIFISIIRSNT